ncbi:MAG: hypothetical protein KJ723_15525 [candidate division Zixibacteria bacterium]|nr:hypothetical protein [candidate division Zixibacteria bacterium]
MRDQKSSRVAQYTRSQLYIDGDNPLTFHRQSFSYFKEQFITENAIESIFMTDAIDIYLHGSKLDSVFELLGTKENDITYSLGWALSHSPTLLDGLLAQIFPSSMVFPRESGHIVK